jgi:uncharacterized protein YlaI
MKAHIAKKKLEVTCNFCNSKFEIELVEKREGNRIIRTFYCPGCGRSFYAGTSKVIISEDTGVKKID